MTPFFGYYNSYYSPVNYQFYTTNSVTFGTDQDDVIYGDYFDRTVYGYQGNDILHGSVGAETFYGAEGADIFYASFGDDVFYGGTGDDIAYGEDGNDTLEGGDGDDILDGGAGNNTLLGGEGRDHLFAGAGDDILNGGEGRDYIKPGLGADNITGGDGIDTLDYSDTNYDVVYDSDQGAAATTGSHALSSAYGDIINDIIENVKTGGGDDYIVGDDGNNRYETGNGHDVIHARGGDDYIISGGGNNTVYAGEGNNYVDGTGGSSGTGDPANDPGQDYVYAGSGNDYVRQYGSAYIDVGDGNNVVIHNYYTASEIHTGSGNDLIIGGGLIYSGLGDDIISLNQYVSTVYDDGGNDTIVYNYGNNVGVIDMTKQGTDVTAGSAVGSYAYGDAFYGTFENAIVSGNATVIGNDLDNAIDVISAGTNFVYGNGGADRIRTSAGVDYVEGGDGDDYITTYLGDDTIYGGAGDDYIDGDRGHDTIYGGDGNDHLIGFTGDNNMYGGAGDDYIESSLGGSGTLSGGDGNDEILGGTGIKVIDGGAGDDIIHGNVTYNSSSVMSDTLTGGSGADTFLYKSQFDSRVVYGIDQITDFEVGIDTIDLSLITSFNAATTSVDHNGGNDYTLKSGPHDYFQIEITTTGGAFNLADVNFA